jgi:hypothetical protein
VIGKTDRAGCGERLHSSRDIYPIAINIALVDDDIANVDANAEFEPTIFGDGRVAFSHNALDLHGAAHSIDRARKFD